VPASAVSFAVTFVRWDTYDNPAENPRNTQRPPRRVTFGPETSDETGDLWLSAAAQP
jgi:hypothetical protein